MSYKRKCKECGKAFIAQRSTKTFCKSSCQVNYHQKQKRTGEKITADMQVIKKLGSEIDQAEVNISGHKFSVEYASQKLRKLNEEIKLLQTELGKDKDTFRNEHTTLGKYSKDPNAKDLGLLGIGLNIAALMISPQQMQQKAGQFYQELQQKLKEKYQQEKKLKSNRQQIKDLQELVLKKKKAKQALEDKLSKLLVTLPEPPQVKPPLTAKPKAVAKSGQDGVGAQDFLKENFKTFQLPGNLGQFLGDLERRMLFITLIGDAGAGKSTLTMGIGQKFDQAGLKVIFFSLELGRSKPLKDMIRRYPPSNNFRIVCSEDELMQSKTPLEAIRESADHYDVIMIDSFGKLNCKTEELDKLRNDFPKTLFLSIAQKTSSGTIRGGAAVSFDSSMVVNVIKEEDPITGKKKRVAIMQKSRYGTQDWKYYVEEDRYVEP